METRTYWPFEGFFLKPYDEKYGTHLYQDYLKELAENPITEEEKRMRHESTLAAIAEMDRSYEEALKKEAAEREARCEEPDSAWEMWKWMEADPEPEERPTQEAAEQQDDAPAEGQCTGAMMVPDRTPEAVQPAGRVWVSDLIGEDFKRWETGRVILDCGTGRGKNEFIIKKLAGWLVDMHLRGGSAKRKILYLCPLNSLHAEMIRRRLEAEIADLGEEAAAELTLYEDVLEVQTYQHIEKLCRNNPTYLEGHLSGFKYIAADECHYFTDFSTYNINTDLSLEVLQSAERDHVVIYMSATGGQVFGILNAASETPPDRIYTLPQDYGHVRQRYFYVGENLPTILNDLPADEKAVIFMSSGEDLAKMKAQFGDAAGYYCSENNPKYGRKFDALEDCIKDRKLQKRFVFTTKAIGMGIEIKDRTVKHIFIDQWKPNDIAQSMGRKRPLDADDTCTVYFRDYDADWYMGGLKKFLSIIEEELKPVEAYLAGEKAFAEYRHSKTPDTIQKALTKSKVMEWDAYQNSYRVNQLGVQQLRDERDILKEMIDGSYKEVFAKHAQVDLEQEIQPYRVNALEEWIRTHLDQPMRKDVMYAEIMGTKAFAEYKGRPMGQSKLNEKLRSYGVQIISEKNRKRGENYQVTLWRLTKID